MILIIGEDVFWLFLRLFKKQLNRLQNRLRVVEDITWGLVANNTFWSTKQNRFWSILGNTSEILYIRFFDAHVLIKAKKMAAFRMQDINPFFVDNDYVSKPVGFYGRNIDVA